MEAQDATSNQSHAARSDRYAPRSRGPSADGPRHGSQWVPGWARAGWARAARSGRCAPTPGPSAAGPWYGTRWEPGWARAGWARAARSGRCAYPAAGSRQRTGQPQRLGASPRAGQLRVAVDAPGQNARSASRQSARTAEQFDGHPGIPGRHAAPSGADCLAGSESGL